MANEIIDQFIDEEDEARAEAENEHRLAQAALRLKRIEVPEGKIKRYQSATDESSADLCDRVWVDRLTGKVVIRYDLADPANTNSYYGAESDEAMFASVGLDPYELIDKDAAKPMPFFEPHWSNFADDDYPDDGYDDGDVDDAVPVFVDDETSEEAAFEDARREAEAENRRRDDETRAWREYRDGDYRRIKTRVEYKKCKTKKQRKIARQQMETAR